MHSGVTRRLLGLGLVAGSTSCASAQSVAVEPPPALDQRLTPISRFVGRWRGTVTGEPGTGTVERTYAPILAGKFIEERNASRHVSGEVHHHIAYWSFDRRRSRFVLRQFHVESFVNQFVATTAEFVGGRLVIDSESIENIPPGFRARETYVFDGENSFDKLFEIAEPNGEFSLYSHNRFRRA